LEAELFASGKARPGEAIHRLTIRMVKPSAYDATPLNSPAPTRYFDEQAIKRMVAQT
jgi:hypothetical protein